MAEVKECMEPYLHSQYAFMAWCSIKRKHRDFSLISPIYKYYILEKNSISFI